MMNYSFQRTIHIKIKIQFDDFGIRPVSLESNEEINTTIFPVVSCGGTKVLKFHSNFFFRLRLFMCEKSKRKRVEYQVENPIN